MENILAFLALKLVEIGFVLTVALGIGIIGGSLFGLATLIVWGIKKILGDHIDMEKIAPFFLIGFFSLCIIGWIIANCIATPVVVSKWEQNPQINKVRIAWNHCLEIDKETKEKK